MDTIKHLTLKHKELDVEIAELQNVKPEFLTLDQETRLHDLKKQKLRIKDEIARLRKKTDIQKTATDAIIPRF